VEGPGGVFDHRAGFDAVLDAAAGHASRYLDTIDDRPVGATVSLAELRERLSGELNGAPLDAVTVVDDLVAAVEGGLVATGSPRYFGFVIGGSLPAALGADWMTSAWDQNVGLYAGGPAAAVAEEVVGRWVADLLGLPAGVSFGLVTGCQMAHVTCFAAARHHVLAAEGWDVARQGLAGAPPVRVLAGARRHVTIGRALALLGIGTDAIVPVADDDSARMRPDALADALADGSGPTIVSIQVGEVNTGAIDPVAELCDVIDGSTADAWVHIDGAFGLWAAASPSRRHLVEGIERADSWATDAHKWLNVPYDSGLALCAHPDDHRAAMTVQAPYLEQSDADGPRVPMDWNPEFSRRARGFSVYAALRSLGRQGVADLVTTSCDLALHLAERLRAEGVTVVNDVVLNQVLVRFPGPVGGDGSAKDLTPEVLAAAQDGGTCWMSGTVWEGEPAMRISVTNWRTGEADIERTVEALVRAARAAG
jgi:glutamate/tyrosine decarboxylase-like PLP-dependent enzyme